MLFILYLFAVFVVAAYLRARHPKGFDKTLVCLLTAVFFVLLGFSRVLVLCSVDKAALRNACLKVWGRAHGLANGT